MFTGNQGRQISNGEPNTTGRGRGQKAGRSLVLERHAYCRKVRGLNAESVSSNEAQVRVIRCGAGGAEITTTIMAGVTNA